MQPPEKSYIKLIDAICAAYDNPAYRPVIQDGKIVTTYCNVAANEIAQKMGCHDLHDTLTGQVKTADEMADYFFNNPNDWLELRCAGLKPDAMDMAFHGIQAWANMGYLIFAVMRSAELGSAHGHICVIRPGIMKSSGKWGQVPVCMNIGKECFIALAQSGPMKGLAVGINEAFVPIPHFYIWRKQDETEI